MPSIDEERIANSDYPDQTAPLGPYCLHNISVGYQQKHHLDYFGLSLMGNS